MRKKDKFGEYACDMKNEAVCEEELDEEELEFDEVEKKHFDEDLE